MILKHLENGKSIIITTNLTFNRWEEIFVDPTLTAAMVDRIAHKATVINIKGDSYAFAKICNVLPHVIRDIVDNLPDLMIEQNTVLVELVSIDRDLVKALYLLAFL